MTRHPLPWCLAGALLLAGAGPARAHGIQSSLERLAPLTDGRSFTTARGAGAAPLQLESRYSSGLPASDALVKLVPPDGGAPIAVGRTDEQGRLTFALPAAARADWELQVDAGPGHRDYLELPAGRGGEQALGRPHPAAPLLATAVPLAAAALLGCVAAGRPGRRPRP